MKTKTSKRWQPKTETTTETHLYVVFTSDFKVDGKTQFKSGERVKWYWDNDVLLNEGFTVAQPDSMDTRRRIEVPHNIYYVEEETIEKTVTTSYNVSYVRIQRSCDDEMR